MLRDSASFSKNPAPTPMFSTLVPGSNLLAMNLTRATLPAKLATPSVLKVIPNNVLTQCSSLSGLQMRQSFFGTRSIRRR